MRPFLSVVWILLVALPAGARSRIVILGDSLTEGYNLPKESAFPALLEKKFKAEGRDVEVVNAGISGSTTASLAGRLRWQLKSKPDLLVIALGANDGLRGLPVAEARRNLAQGIVETRKAGVPVMLAGIKLPPNYGKEYSEGFDRLFKGLASEYKVPLIPFLLEGVAGNPALNLEDGIHPNEKGHRILADRLYPPIARQLSGSAK